MPFAMSSASCLTCIDGEWGNEKTGAKPPSTSPHQTHRGLPSIASLPATCPQFQDWCGGIRARTMVLDLSREGVLQNVAHVLSAIRPNNVRSRRLLTRLGFSRTRSDCPNGRHLYRYSLDSSATHRSVERALSAGPMSQVERYTEVAGHVSPDNDLMSCSARSRMLGQMAILPQRRCSGFDWSVQETGVAFWNAKTSVGGGRDFSNQPPVMHNQS